MSLATSSPFIAKQLSDEHIFLDCALRILTASNGSDASLAKELSALLQCRWMTWERFTEVLVTVHRIKYPNAKERPSFNDLRRQPVFRPELLGPSVHIPEKLLQGPWSKGKTEFLHYLVWLHLTIDWDHSTVGEFATTGLHQAIAERNGLAVASLVSPGVGVEPSMASLRAAIIEHGCDQTIVWHLLNAAIRCHISARGQAKSPHSIETNFRDPSIWSWISRAQEAVGNRASWLKEALKYSADLSSAHSVYDDSVAEEFSTLCGRERDGVEQISVPLSRPMTA